MIEATAFRKFLAAIFIAAFAAMSWYVPQADAQQRQRATAEPAPGVVYGSNRGVGGHSATLSDVWGPAKMPPAPKDFGPHFDFQPDNLNSGLSHSPYPSD